MFEERFARMQRDLTVLKSMIVAATVLTYIRLLHAILVCE